MGKTTETTLPAEHARMLLKLKKRRQKNRGIKRKNNASLPVGAPMYFYCNGCGAEIAVPENYTSRNELCDECQEMKKQGLL